MSETNHIKKRTFIVGIVVAIIASSGVSVLAIKYMLNFRARERITTITGIYSYIGNPCTTSPCLPGMVYVVCKDHQFYYLTVNRIWLWENQSWEGYLPKEGDLVTVIGYLSTKQDIKGMSFYEMEVISLKRAQ